MTACRATLVKRMTADGLVELNDDVPIGTARVVDVDTIREAVFWNHVWQKAHTKLIVDVVCDGCGGSHAWLPVELLKIEARQ